MLESLSVFFPALNEETNIKLSIETAYKTLPSIAYRYEVIVVDDGSSDQTASIVNQMMDQYPSLRLVQHPHNLGYGAALATGFETSHMKWVFFTDCDLQFDLSEIATLLPYTTQYFAVLGYRKNRADSLHRKVFASLWHLSSWIFLGVHARDIDCAFKLIQKDIINSIKISCAGAAVSSELLSELHRVGCKWFEVPVSHYPRKSGEQTGAKVTVILNALSELILLSTRRVKGDIEKVVIQRGETASK